MKVLVISHDDPDGIASMAILRRFLSSSGADVDVMMTTPLVYILPNFDPSDYDWILIADSGSNIPDMRRIAELSEEKRVTVIDHHILLEEGRAHLERARSSGAELFIDERAPSASYLVLKWVWNHGAEESDPYYLFWAIVGLIGDGAYLRNRELLSSLMTKLPDQYSIPQADGWGLQSIMPRDPALFYFRTPPGRITSIIKNLRMIGSKQDWDFLLPRLLDLSLEDLSYFGESFIAQTLESSARSMRSEIRAALSSGFEDGIEVRRRFEMRFFSLPPPFRPGPRTVFISFDSQPSFRSTFSELVSSMSLRVLSQSSPSRDLTVIAVNRRAVRIDGLDEQVMVGSVRTLDPTQGIPSFRVAAAIMDDLKIGGGHDEAAGFSIRPKDDEKIVAVLSSLVEAKAREDALRAARSFVEVR